MENKLFRRRTVKKSITKLQIRQIGQAGLRFKQLLCGRPHWGAGRYMNKIKVQFYEDNTIDDNKLEFAVILAKYQNKWIYCKHKERDTWEIPGGHREKNEEILNTAKRELKEETGAQDFTIIPIAIYSVTVNNKTNYGKLFYSEVKEMSQNLEYEIEKIQLFDDIPGKLTYPEIQPYLYKYIVSKINRNRKEL